MPPGHQPIQGSEKEPLPGATKVGPVPAEQEVRVSIILRRRGGAELPAVEPSGQALSRREFAERFGADPTDLERIEQFAAEHGLEVRESDAARRTVVVAGPAEAVARAFAVELDEYEHEGVRYREAEGFAAARATSGFTPREIAGLYDFPSDLDGSGQKIALIELGGGFRPEDLDAYFEAIGVPTPVVTAVSVAGQPNSPSTADSDDGEVVLDIEVAGAVAPGAEILVYFARNTDRGFHDAITTAVHDPREPTIVSISWGAPEDASWTEQSRLSYDEAFQEAAALGVTVLLRPATMVLPTVSMTAERTSIFLLPARMSWLAGAPGSRARTGRSPRSASGRRTAQPAAASAAPSTCRPGSRTPKSTRP